MTFCLVAEGPEAQEHIWNWLRANHSPARYPQEALERTKYMYRQRMIYCLLEARAFWAAGSNVLEDPLETFERAEKLSERGVFINLRPLAAWISKAFRSEARRTVDVSTFDRAVIATRCYAGTEEDGDLQLARLMLKHPTKADGTMFRRFWERCASTDPKGPFIKDLLQSDSPGVKIVLYQNIVESAQQLHVNGRVQEARWVLDFGREARPDVIGERSHVPYLKAPDHLRPGLRQAARTREIERGMKTNPDGSRVDDHELHRKIYQAYQGIGPQSSVRSTDSPYDHRKSSKSSARKIP
ncbi:hypothetical protein LTR37_002660 [Vermiconidia calcicola]|uniref:Uncharacterized protein n=1 Tax=Vermiconidia calcicola TaxID=1690605 RepID=A0ACC3NT71_9PEZI|nr:hypothetical protein LTR37_002660 [Vermiconidia calcicola]